MWYSIKFKKFVAQVIEAYDMRYGVMLLKTQSVTTGIRQLEVPMADRNNVTFTYMIIHTLWNANRSPEQVAGYIHNAVERSISIRKALRQKSMILTIPVNHTYA